MRMNWILATVLALGLGLAPLGAGGAAATERPISGLVTEVYARSQTVYIGAEEFVVPSRVYDLRELPVGTHVVVTFERSSGKRVATSLEVAEAQ